MKFFKDLNLIILFIYFILSGTTGKPKCITSYGAGNVLIEHNKEFMLHCNIKDNDKLFCYATTGWDDVELVNRGFSYRFFNLFV